jgi:hypothetical protein
MRGCKHVAFLLDILPRLAGRFLSRIASCEDNVRVSFQSEPWIF